MTLPARFRSKPLTSGDPMPFGKHQGCRLDAVPASYLLYIVRQDWIRKWPALRAYILNNQELLEEDAHYDDDEWDFYWPFDD